MPIPVELLELRSRLEEVGMVVVEEPDHLVVRLPYFCSVRIRATDGRLRFEPYLGLLPRTRATLLKLGGFGVIALMSFRLGAPYAATVGVAGLLVCVYDVLRVMITENVITRATFIYSQMRRWTRADFPTTAAGSPAIGSQRPRELSAGEVASRPGTPDDLPRSAVESIIKRR